MTKVAHGKVHGKTIELDEDIGVAEPPGGRSSDQIDSAGEGPWGEGILRTAGALADDPYWDAIMEEVHLSRKIEGTAPNGGMNDAPPGHEHLLGSHAASRRFGPSFLSICGWACNFNGGPGGAVLWCVQAPESIPAVDFDW